MKENCTLSPYHGCNWMSLNTDSLTDDHHRLTHHLVYTGWWIGFGCLKPPQFHLIFPNQTGLSHSFSKYLKILQPCSGSSSFQPFPWQIRCYFFWWSEFAWKKSSIHPSHLLDLQKWNLQWGSAPWLWAASSWSEGLWPAATVTWPAVGVTIWWDLGCCSGICFGLSYGIILYEWNMYDMCMIYVWYIYDMIMYNQLYIRLFIDIDIDICENEI